MSSTAVLCKICGFFPLSFGGSCGRETIMKILNAAVALYARTNILRLVFFIKCIPKKIQ